MNLRHLLDSALGGGIGGAAKSLVPQHQSMSFPGLPPSALHNPIQDLLHNLPNGGQPLPMMQPKPMLPQQTGGLHVQPSFGMQPHGSLPEDSLTPMDYAQPTDYDSGQVSLHTFGQQGGLPNNPQQQQGGLASYLHHLLGY